MALLNDDRAYIRTVRSFALMLAVAILIAGCRGTTSDDDAARRRRPDTRGERRESRAPRR